MQYSLEPFILENNDFECLIIGLIQNQSFSADINAIDEKVHGIISQLMDRGDFVAENANTLLLNYIADSSIKRVLLVGLGEADQLTAKNYRKAIQAAINSIKSAKLTKASILMTDCRVIKRSDDWNARQLIEICHDTYYQFQESKSIKEPSSSLALELLSNSTTHEALQSGLEQGIAIAQGIELTKFLADLPGNICTPAYLAETATIMAAELAKLDVEILEESQLQKLGMGSFLSVSKGSREPAKLIALNYQGLDKESKPVVLVGKGLTFDAGGISLKPGAGMDEMKYDMCGGASVLGAIKAAASMKLPLNIVGLIPASENLPDGNANKPGDVVTSMAGLTIEILNTDAEGRLILCDTLTYAKKYNPDVVIDMATLTGACIVALGRVPSAILSNNDDLTAELIQAGDQACDSLWRLPIWDEYQDQLKSNFADMANIGGRDGGTITAACFLSRFTEDYQWAHLDIAGTAWRTGHKKGATGRPVPLLCQYLINKAYGDGGS